jgi:N-acetylglucosaminyl-diphospho-decaprenol L-rhamnosyltransferase
MTYSVSFVIPVLINNREIYRMTVSCIKDVLNSVNICAEIIVVDDGSRCTQYADMLKLCFKDKIEVVSNKTNLGFARAVNAGIRKTSDEYIVILNNDVIIDPSYFYKAISSMECNGIDIAAPNFGAISVEGDYLGESTEKQPNDKRGYSYLVGWCLIARKNVFKSIGLLPEEFGTGFFEDTLYSQYLLASNVRLAAVGSSGIRHLGHKTFMSEKINLSEAFRKNKKIFLDIMRNKMAFQNLSLPKWH